MKVIYVYDALCGWCYGFSPVIQKFYEQERDNLGFEVVSGGMVTGDRIRPVSEMAGFISRASKNIEETTGIEFGKEFLEKTLNDNTIIFSSIPPALALSAFKVLSDDGHTAFAGSIQKAIYYYGLDPMDDETYGKIAEDYGIDKDDFIREMNKPETMELATADFKRSSELGVSGFPTVLIEHNGNFYPIARGSVSFDRLNSEFERIKKQLTDN